MVGVGLGVGVAVGCGVSVAVDILDEKDHYLVVADLPGIDKKDLKVRVEDDVLSISGEKKLENRGREKGSHYFERRYGSFRRSFRLPDHVDASSVQARYENGELTVRINKKPEAQPKAIDVKIS